MNVNNMITEIHAFIKKSVNDQLDICKKNPTSDNEKMLNHMYLLGKSFKQYIARAKKYNKWTDEEYAIIIKVIKDLYKTSKLPNTTLIKRIMLMRGKLDESIGMLDYMGREREIEGSQIANALYKSKFTEVVYELENDRYYINGERVKLRPKKFFWKKEKEEFIRAKLKKEKVEYIFKNNEKLIKKCDPNLVVVLARKNIDLARQYIEMLSQPKKSYQNKNFSITYDLRGYSKIFRKQMSLFDKIKMKLMVKNNKKVAEVISDKHSKWGFAVIPLVGALAFSWFGGFQNQNGKQNSNVKEGHSYSDDITADNSFETESTTVFEQSTNTKKASSETSKSTTGVTTKTKSSTSSSTSYLEDIKTSTTYTTSYDENAETTTYSYEQEFENTDVKNDTENTDNTIIQEHTEQNSQKEKSQVYVRVGDKINVQEGLKYTADCYGGGNSNRIGAVSWRPATQYNVDGVAFMYNGKLLSVLRNNSTSINDEVGRYAKQLGVSENEITTSVLLSLVPGIADTGWAPISLDQLKETKVNLNKDNKLVIPGVSYEYDLEK